MWSPWLHGPPTSIQESSVDWSTVKESNVEVRVSSNVEESSVDESKAEVRVGCNVEESPCMVEHILMVKHGMGVV